MTGLTVTRAIDTYNAMLREPMRGEHIRGMLRKWGYDPDRLAQLPDRKLRKLVDRLKKYDRDLFFQQQMRLDAHRINEEPLTDIEFEEMKRREDLHVSLRSWARGPLTMERPQSSSLHLLAEYDLEHCGDHVETAKSSMVHDQELQVIVVENDWGAVVPTMDGEWHLPFRLTCWEFRISGVRVLAMVDVTNHEKSLMFLIYGRDGLWVVDDYNYRIVGGLGPGVPHRPSAGNAEFRGVVQKVHDCIRASCVMIDAQVASREVVHAPTKLKERRVREGRVTLRDHYVVRLLHTERRSYSNNTDRATSGPRALQRGHWRKGTWVHFDDQDSGKVQYVNDGGFIVSKTWRRWHFAGDPRNILHKEYRL